MRCRTSDAGGRRGYRKEGRTEVKKGESKICWKGGRKRGRKSEKEGRTESKKEESKKCWD